LPEELANIGDKQVGFFHGREMPPRSNSLQCTMLSDNSAKRLMGGAIS
jgi:hypothetical protein